MGTFGFTVWVPQSLQVHMKLIMKFLFLSLFIVLISVAVQAIPVQDEVTIEDLKKIVPLLKRAGRNEEKVEERLFDNLFSGDSYYEGLPSNLKLSYKYLFLQCFQRTFSKDQCQQETPGKLRSALGCDKYAEQLEQLGELGYGSICDNL